MSTIGLLGGLGGIITFIGAVTLIIKAIFRQVNAIDDNTELTVRIADQVQKMVEKLNDHDVRIHILEDRSKR